MDRRETEALESAFKIFTKTYDKNHRFAAKDICFIHKTWLKKIYSWAGQYRNTNLSKDDFHFAAAREIPRLMAEFEKKILSRFTPGSRLEDEELTHALAVVHTELVLIHPFREGNGRVARVLSDLMCLQAGLPSLDYRMVKGAEKKAYFRAVQAGLDRNYQPMTILFKKIIQKSIL
ncbi:MAG: Fic family protein [Gammaproteobacteria bacterium]|nr:Fic family protein [Gammaproteobacteria bacterium]